MPVASDLTGTIRGYRIFTAFRTANGKIFQKEAHIQRVMSSANDIYMDLPCTEQELDHLLEDVLKKNSHLSEDLLLEIIFSGGEADENGLAPIGNTLLYILVFPIKTPSAELIEKGIALASYPFQRPYAHIKLMNYIGAILAYKTVVKQYNAHQPLFVSPGDTSWVLEGSTFNIFSVVGNTLYTPPLDGHILPGITRKIVIKLAQKAGLTVKEEPLLLDDLLAADEVFITSSMRNVLSVSRIDHTSISKVTNRATTKMLAKAFQTYLDTY